ncbi:ATP-binding protein [Methylovirgula sp. HY1]|uniref:ATP-binding protein n=1 Tax=Methylovirgula sp. HY1 TaxID=2822761 RepID=UPI001C5BE146|nr:ATP-binding protein [Methylovirgula sp. HY1]QXX73519.1 Sensor kinase CusS [Methylovirgula sp. HY1]
MTALGKLFRTTAFKISVVYLLLSALGAGLVLARVGWNVRQLIDEQLAQTVNADITGLAEQYDQGGVKQLVQAIQRRIRQPGADLYLLTTFAGEPIVGNIVSLPPGVLSHPGLVETDYLRSGDVAAHHRALARIFALPGGFHLLVGHDVEEGMRLRHILAGALATSLFWLILIGTIGGLWAARRVLHRVDKINAQAQTIVTGGLSGRVPLAGTGDELDRLVQNLNAMLDRIQVLMQGLKEVSDNIAHDLRTPLTRLRSRAEQALHTAKTVDDYRSALEKVIEESDGLIRIFNALLMIARAEAGTGFDGMVDFDPASVARDVAELYEPLAEDNGVMLALDVDTGLTLRGSRELVGQALANLVDNALKYGMPPQAGEGAQAEAAVIVLSAKRHGHFIEISVADRGPGIAVEDRTRVLDRFTRLENSRSRPGSGLGLALAAAVARLHNGRLLIEDNEPGLRVVLALPAGVRVPPLLAAPLVQAQAGAVA